MKSQLHLKKALITALFVIISVAVFAQTGKISGKVSDKKTGETLIGVTVKIKGTTKGSSTDVEGRYSIGALTTGKYTLEVSYVGYATKNITDIEVKSGNATLVDLVMEEGGSQKLNEVVITATVKQESVNTLYARQKNSASISDGISADQIRRSPDRSTADVLKRVSGTTVQDNKFIIVRGLSDRYNQSTLNNAIMPSTEPDRKAFSFDLIPSNMIDNVVINKTASPDLPGDFAGGVVQVTTKDFPDQNFINVNAGLGYNSQSTFKEFFGDQRGSLDFLSIPDGSRNLPATFPSKTQIGSSLQTRLNASRSLPNDWAYYNYGKALPSQNLQFTIGRAYRSENNNSFGAILSLNYRNAETKSFIQRQDGDNGALAYNYADDQNKSSSTLGGLLNLAYSFGKNKISSKTIYNRVLDNQFIFRDGRNFDSGNLVQGYSTQVTEKSLISTTLEGNHFLDRTKLNWNVSYSKSIKNDPDLRKMAYFKDLSFENDPSKPFIAYVPGGSASPSFAGKFYSSLTDDIISGNASAILPLNFINDKSTAKVGYYGQYKKRTFAARVLGYISNNYNGNNFDQNLLLLPIDKIFDPANIKEGGFVIDDITSPLDAYDANSMINAGYVMFDNRFTEKLRLVWGARVESFNQQLTAVSSKGVDETYFNVLPSANLTYSLTEKANLRASYSNTVSIPEFRELAPFTFYDFNTSSTLVGNPNLVLTKITNADLRYEWYPAAGQLVSASVFYKHFNNPIEQKIIPGTFGNNRGRSYQNAESAKTYGAEIEFRKSLDFISDKEWVKNFMVFSNASYIKSSVNTNGLNSASLDRPLQGQSPYIINAGIQYSAMNNSLNATVLYNRNGRRIADVGSQGYNDIYENSRDQLDFQISKKLLKGNAELKLNINDILNQKVIFYQDEDNSKSYTAGRDNLISSLRTGVGSTLSFSYTFK